MCSLWEEMLLASTCKVTDMLLPASGQYTDILLADDKRIAFEIIGGTDVSNNYPNLYYKWGVEGSTLGVNASPPFSNSVSLYLGVFQYSWFLQGNKVCRLLSASCGGLQGMGIEVTETILPCSIQEFARLYNERRS